MDSTSTNVVRKHAKKNEQFTYILLTRGTLLKLNKKYRKNICSFLMYVPYVYNQ